LFDSAGSAGNLIPHTLSHGTYKRLKKNLTISPKVEKYEIFLIELVGPSSAAL